MPCPPPEKDTSIEKAIRTFEAHGGVMRTSELMTAGTNAGTLYSMRDQGIVEPVTVGVYRLASQPELSKPDLVAVARRIPKAVVCLVSALDFHEITTRIPHAVEIMLPRGSWTPKLRFPPIEVHQAQAPIYELGIETHNIDATDIKVYDVEKTLVDCVKYRNQLGTELVIEALRFYRQRKPLQVNKLMGYARKCRVAKVMEMYLDGIL